MITEFMSVAEMISVLGAAAALWVALAERKKKNTERESILSDAAIRLVDPLKARIEILESEISIRTQTISMLSKRIDYLETEIETRDKLIASMGIDLDGKKAQISAMQEELHNKTRTINKLEKEVHKLMEKMYCGTEKCDLPEKQD